MPAASETELMRKLLENARTIAVVGASDKAQRAAHGVMRFLQDKGFRCIPVNPRLAGQVLLGEIVQADLAAIDEHIDIVDVFRNSEDAGDTVDEAIAAGAGAIWMQLGVINPAAAARAEAAGLKVVMNRCPAQEWSRLGLD